MGKLNELKEFLFERKYLIVIGGVVVFLLIIGIYFITDSQNNNQEIVFKENITQEKEEVIEEVKCNIKVDIKGEVKKPGLYEIF